MAEHEPEPRFRLSVIDYLNSLPLNLAFKLGFKKSQLELIWDFPSQCADHLAAGHVDGGLISSIEYQRIPNLKVVPNVAIASKREVKSVLIFSKKPFEQIRTLAADRFSRSSEALIRILFQKKAGIQPKSFRLGPDLNVMLQYADAALIIGDPALTANPEGLHVFDLAQMWFELTGLPFVFAFWALRAHPYQKELAELIQEAKKEGISQWPDHLSDLEKRWGLHGDLIRSYLTENIHFGLGKDEITSLNQFYTFAAELNLIPEVKPLQWA